MGSSFVSTGSSLGATVSSLGASVSTTDSSFCYSKYISAPSPEVSISTSFSSFGIVYSFYD